MPAPRRLRLALAVLAAAAPAMAPASAQETMSTEGMSIMEGGGSGLGENGLTDRAPDGTVLRPGQSADRPASVIDTDDIRIRTPEVTGTTLSPFATRPTTRIPSARQRNYPSSFGGNYPSSTLDDRR